MTRCRHLLICLATLGLLLAGQAGSVVAGPRQDEIKAAFIFNFARFTEWPADSFVSNTSPMNICFPERHPLADPLAGIDGEHVGHRAIRLVPGGQSGGAIGTCHIVLVSESGTTLPRNGILTVGDMPGFAEAGGAVELIQIGRQVRFQINESSVRGANLRMSSKLLRLATRVLK